MYLKEFYCLRCGKRSPADVLLGCCDVCGGLLTADYDYAGVSSYLHREDLRQRTDAIWRYKEVLPLEDESNIVTMGEGGSPVLPLKKTGKVMRLERLFLKDESVQPCGTFKSRAASVTVSKALEAGVETIVLCADDLEGYSWACYAAAAGIRAVILTPADTLRPPLAQAILNTGARLYPYIGGRPEAESLAARSAVKHGWFHVSAFYTPYRQEGKKILAFEIAEYFEWSLPDVIICPVDRDGVFTGIYRGLRDLQRLGWTPARLPRLVAVQEEGRAPVVQAWSERRTELAVPDAPEQGQGMETNRSWTLCESQSAFLVLDGIYKSLGCALAVRRADMEKACGDLARREGVVTSLSGAASLAAAERLTQSGWLQSSERVLLLTAESGLYDIRAVPQLLEKLRPIAADLPELPAS